MALEAIYSLLTLGPTSAGNPVLLAAMPEGPAMLLLVMGLFVALQSVEGYLINPLIRKQAVYLPPACSGSIQVC